MRSRGSLTTYVLRHTASSLSSFQNPGARRASTTLIPTQRRATPIRYNLPSLPFPRNPPVGGFLPSTITSIPLSPPSYPGWRGRETEKEHLCSLFLSLRSTVPYPKCQPPPPILVLLHPISCVTSRRHPNRKSDYDNSTEKS